MTALLEACGLRVDVGGRTVVQHLDLALRPGERLAVLGRNGAGKSSLLATLAGLRSPAAGEIRLQGKPYADRPARDAARLRAWLGQVHYDPFASTVLETVLTGRHPHLGRWDWESAADARLMAASTLSFGMFTARAF